jgi:putative hydrolase of the HAD superfamily
MKKYYKHLFFDLDNTLWDFRANSREAFQEIFLTHGLDRLVPDFGRFVAAFEKYNEKLWIEYRRGRISKDILRTERIMLALSETGIDDPILARKVGESYLKTVPTKTTLVPGVHDTLSYLKEKYSLYILTNGFVEVQMQKIRNSGIEPYFRRLFMAEMVGYQKPDHRFFEYAVKSVHAHKTESLMIGDDVEVDIQGAKNAGLDQVFFNPGRNKTAIEPTWEIHSMAALKEIL